MNIKDTDQVRRQEFKKYFEKALKGDRQVLIEAGVSKGRITQYLDPSEPFGEKAARGIEDRLKLDRGTIFPSLVAGLANTPKSKNKGIPVVGRAKLGDQESYFAELEYPVGCGEGYIDWPSRDPNAYALLCIGDSMKPRIKHGEFVVIEPNHTYVAGDEVMVKDLTGRVMIKQFTFNKNGMIYFASVNETYAPFGILVEQIDKIHYVAGIAKSALHIEE